MSKMELENSANTFLIYFLGTVLVCIISILSFVIIVDPNDSLFISPKIDRYPSTKNQRYSYTPIMRSQDFNSLILGTSTTRMLKPAVLDKSLGLNFANLSMNTGLSWEQMEVFKLFVKSRETTKLVIWGIDGVWCGTNAIYQQKVKYQFPYWLYDENRWNDFFHILDFQTIKSAFKQVQIIFGTKEPYYGKDGYRHLNISPAAYDLAKARINIYGQRESKPYPKPLKDPAIPLELRKKWLFPDIVKLKKLIDNVSNNIKIVFMMVPYHDYSTGAVNGTRKLTLEECKNRIKLISKKHDNVDYIDFMISSDFTRTDHYYWDKVHYNDQGTQIITKALIDFIAKGRKNSNIYRSSK